MLKILFTIALLILIVRQFYNILLISRAPKISPQEVINLRHNEYMLIDVRTSDEFKNFHIKNSRHLPLNQLSQRKKEIPHNKKIIVVCQSGVRSAQAAMQLIKSGFNDVKSLKGGIASWKKDNCN